jgi:hypothetical protein
MNYRRLLLVLGFSLAVLPAICRPAFAQVIPPTPDQLAKAAYVLQAKAEQMLSPTEWLFSDVKLLGWRISEVLPQHIIGWWTIAPPDARQWQVMVIFPPAPQQASLLKAGETFILLADENFHLLGVYPPDVIPEYASPAKTPDNFPSFDVRVWSARQLNQLTKNLYNALEAKDWEAFGGHRPGPDEVALTPRLLAEIKSKGGTKVFFQQIGLPRTNSLQTVPYYRFNLTTLTPESAEVRLFWSGRTQVSPRSPIGKSEANPAPYLPNSWMIKFIGLKNQPTKAPMVWQIDSITPESN